MPFTGRGQRRGIEADPHSNSPATISAHASGVNRAASSRERAPALCRKAVVLHEAAQGGSQRFDVARGNAEAVDAVLDQVPRGAHRVRRDERQTGGCGLVQRHSPGLRARRQHERVGGRIPARAARRGRRGRGSASAPARAAREPLLLRARAGDHELSVDPVERATAARRRPSRARGGRRRGSSSPRCRARREAGRGPARARRTAHRRPRSARRRRARPARASARTPPRLSRARRTPTHERASRRFASRVAPGRLSRSVLSTHATAGLRAARAHASAVQNAGWFQPPRITKSAPRTRRATPWLRTSQRPPTVRSRPGSHIPVEVDLVLVEAGTGGRGSAPRGRGRAGRPARRAR